MPILKKKKKGKKKAERQRIELSGKNIEYTEKMQPGALAYSVLGFIKNESYNE